MEKRVSPSGCYNSKNCKLFGVPPSFFSVHEIEGVPNLNVLDSAKVHMVPLYETVSAGFGALAVNEVVDYVPLYYKTAAEAQECLCIRVSGDSMYPIISNGDIIVVRRQEAVSNGDVAVVLVDGDDGLVKRWASGDTWVELQSVNPLYKPLRFNGTAAARVKVLGRVQKVIKDL